MNIKQLFPALGAVLAAVMMAGCTSPADTVAGKLGKYVPDDATVVVTFDAARAVKATGCSIGDDGTLEPSDAIDDLLALMNRRNRDDLQSLFATKGMDWSNAVIAVTFKNASVDALVVWSVDDEKEFAKALADELNWDVDLDNGGYVTVTSANDQTSVVMRDGLAFIAVANQRTCHSAKAIRQVEQWADDASHSPLADWKLSHLTQPAVVQVMADGQTLANLLKDQFDHPRYQSNGPAYGMLQTAIKYMADGYTFLTFDVDGAKMTAKMTSTDAQGNARKLPVQGKFDADLFKYTTQTDVFAVAVADFTDLVKYGTEQMPTEIQEIYGDINRHAKGSALFAAGPKGGKTEAFSRLTNMANWHFVLAFQFDTPESASRTLKATTETVKLAGIDIVGQNDKSVTIKYVAGYRENPLYEYWEDGYNTPEYAHITLTADGRNLVATSDSLTRTGNKALEATIPAGSALAIGCALPKTYQLMRTLNATCGFDGTLAVDADAVTMTLQVTDTDMTFFEALGTIMGATLKL